MSNKEKVEKLSTGFVALSEEGKQYVMAVVDALAYVEGLAKGPQPPNNVPKEKSA